MRIRQVKTGIEALPSVNKRNRFTETTYLPDYMGMVECRITYDLDNFTIECEGRVKPMNEFYYRKALELKDRLNKVRNERRANGLEN